MSDSPLPTMPTNQQGQQYSQKNPGNSFGNNHKASGSTNTQTSNATGAKFFAMPGSPQGGRGLPYVTPPHSCLMSESFTGTNVSGDFGNSLTQSPFCQNGTLAFLTTDRISLPFAWRKTPFTFTQHSRSNNRQILTC